MSHALTPPAARTRIERLLDADDHLHGVVVTGADTQNGAPVTYALAIIERRHDGHTYLNERFVMLPSEQTGMDDTFLKNGINRRFTPGLATRLAEVYGSVETRREEHTDETPARIGMTQDTDTVEHISERDA